MIGVMMEIDEKSISEDKDTLLQLAESIEEGIIDLQDKEDFIQKLNELVVDIEEIQKQFFFLDDYLRYLESELRNLVDERVLVLKRPYQTEDWIKERTEYNSKIIFLVEWHNALLRRLKDIEGS